MQECGLRPDPDLLNEGNGRYCPVDDVHVPMVHVPDDLELELPS